MPVPTFKPIQIEEDQVNAHFKEVYDYLATITTGAGSPGPKGDKGDKGDTGSGGGGGFPSMIDTNFFEIKPVNWDGTTVGSFTSGLKKFDGVNGADPRPNVVGSFWGYNTTASGGQNIAGEASYRFAGEIYYHNMMEFHMPDLFTNTGMNVRTNSTYFNRTTGQASTNMQITQLNLKRYDNVNIDWFKVADESGTTRVTLNRSQITGYEELNIGGNSLSTSSANNKLRILTTGVVEFNKHIGGLDGSGLDFDFNGDGTGNKVTFWNGNQKAFQVTKDGVNSDGVNNWKFGAVVNGNPTIIINGVTYNLVVK